MTVAERTTSDEIARIVLKCLEKGGEVEIDGLGLFRPDEHGSVVFLPQIQPKVFLAYAVEDRSAAERLFEGLLASGFDPWMDSRKLLPGQNWPRAIEQAISVSDFFVACFSGRSIPKRGHFQSELRYALDCASRLPLDEVYLIPVRTESCSVPARVQREFQYVDLFPDWEKGLQSILTVIRQQLRVRSRRRAS
ncbi:MAG TPA: TIR domain-containing protein [Bryobacteraceae bacterium]|nr:TIR domain-containing protein [Bryobacteraceae bacterium]